MNPNHPQDDSDPLARLLAQAGPRARPSAAAEARVRAAAQAAWQAGLQRQRRRQWVGWLAAATLTAVAVTLGWRVTRNDAADEIQVATLALSRGEVHVASTATTRTAGPTAIYLRDRIQTGADAGLRLDLSNGAKLRLGAHSELRWRTPSDLELIAGSLYVDSGAQHAAFSIRTPFGNVTHLGTRYQVRVAGDGLGVGVREGQVTLRAGRVETTLRADEYCNLDARGALKRSALGAHLHEWNWVAELAPSFDIENHSLSEFLDWIAAETGYRLEYSDNGVRTAAASTILHGVLGALTPTQALAAIVPTTDFDVRMEAGRLLVQRR